MKADAPAGKPANRNTSGSSGKKPRYDKDGLTNKWEKTSSGKRYKAPAKQDEKPGGTGNTGKTNKGGYAGESGKPMRPEQADKTGNAGHTGQGKRNEHGLNAEKKRTGQTSWGAKSATGGNQGKFVPKRMGKPIAAYRRSMPLTKINFSILCDKLGFTLSDEQADKIVQYLSLLMRWNKAMNLVGAVSWETALSELLVDSFYLAPVMQELTQAWQHINMPSFHMFDVGAGAGLPGIPLRILWQAGTYTMVEAREKRALFLQNALAQLDLPRTNVLQGRAENTLPPCQSQTTSEETTIPHIFLSRAFMPWQEALEFFIPFSQPGDKAIFLLSTPPRSTMLWEHMQAKTYKVGQKNRSIHIFTRK